MCPHYLAGLSGWQIIQDLSRVAENSHQLTEWILMIITVLAVAGMILIARKPV